MQKITRALALVPDHAGAQALKATAEDVIAAQRQAAFIRAAVRNARNRFANGKHQAAFQLLGNLDPSSNPVVADTLKELREALSEIEGRRHAEQELATPPTEAVDEEATRFVLAPGTEARRRSIHEGELLSSTPPPDVEHGASELTLTDARSPEPIQRVEAAARPWRWGLIVGVGVLLLVILAAVFFRSRGV
jgi:hypothetical protein